MAFIFVRNTWPSVVVNATNLTWTQGVLWLLFIIITKHGRLALPSWFVCILSVCPSKYVLHCFRGVFSKLPCKMNTGEKKHVWPSRAYLPKVRVSQQKHSSVAKTVVNPRWRQYWKRTFQRYPHPSVPETSRWLVVPRVAWSPYGTRSSADRKITWWGKKHIQLAADEDWNKPKNNR